MAEATNADFEKMHLAMQRGEKIFVARVVAEDGCVVEEFWDSANKCLCTKTISRPPGYISRLKEYAEHKRDAYGTSGLRNMTPTEREWLSPDSVVAPTLEDEWKQSVGLQNTEDRCVSAYDNAETLASFHRWSSGVFKQDPGSVKAQPLYYRPAPKESRFGVPVKFKVK